VPGDHPAEAIIKGCSAGLIIRARALPRVQERAIVQGSSFTFVSPYLRNISAVQSFACFNCGEPVRRGPISSDKYSRLAMTSL